jgi:3-methyladenine DNA glycosylase AlkD
MNKTKSSAKSVASKLKRLGTPTRAKASAWFFKTAPGQYGHGDIFWGVTVPTQRRVAKSFSDLPLTEISKLLKHKVHECRFTASLILVKQYERADEKEREKLSRFYLKHRALVNNWDLVDLSAPRILGRQLLKVKDRSILYKLADRKNLWERRIAIIATLAFIQQGQYRETLKLAKLLLTDQHDLIHKAVGWALREVGKRSLETEEKFLKQHSAVMPRTMLRYAIEKFPESKRQFYLKQGRL